jgi:hypothetical protein
MIQKHYLRANPPQEKTRMKYIATITKRAIKI